MPYADKDKRLASNRASHAKNPHIKRDWRRRNRKKVQAHSAVARALRAGLLVKGPCEHKGPDCSGAVQAHHEDYDKPLEVRWLCPAHHKAEHHRQAS